MDTKKVWFVTGASKGLGLFLVKRLLKEGYRVAATSRNLAELRREAGEASAAFLPLQVDLLDEASVSGAVSQALDTFGRLDVIVNNAGYGQLGTIEELTDREARQNFDINVFGSLNVIRHAMPHLRSKRSGHIINVSSIGGFSGAFPGCGIYCATKFAVAGFTESLGAEVKEFGVAATVVYPGYFRTNFLNEGSLNLPGHPIAEYTEARKSEAIHLNDIKGNQPGDPEKAALAFIQLAEREQPPLHLFLGSDSFGMATQKIQVLQRELGANEALTKSTDFFVN
jgi:Short-chain alcohol dehydrogenase of unknown specificity